MLLFILILLLVASILGVLGAVLKTALVIAVSIVLAIVFLIALGSYWFRYRVYRFRREIDRRYAEGRRRDGLPHP
ncbi:MAG: hypothetical protein ACT4PO_02405 [Actinomycetota bacterium]